MWNVKKKKLEGKKVIDWESCSRNVIGNRIIGDDNYIIFYVVEVVWLEMMVWS